MSVPRAEAISAWGLKLKGQIGSFQFFPNQTVKSALKSMTLAVAGYAYNDTISIGGWAANSLSTLRVGQWFTVGNQLLRIVDAAAQADANGRVSVTFEPELRKNYAVGTAVEFAKPFGVFRMNSSDSVTYTLDPDRRPDFGTITAREVV